MGKAVKMKAMDPAGIASHAASLLRMVVDDVTIRRATKFLSPSFTIKATRQRRPSKRDRQETILVTLGWPNYAENRFITLAVRAGEPFPVKKAQIKRWPKH